jgi:predicted nucleic acid-binding protein
MVSNRNAHRTPRNESDALQAVALMLQGSVAELTARSFHLAAKISLEHEMPMADSIILATARLYQATVWTQDSDFEGTDGVRYIQRRGSPGFPIPNRI